MPAPDGSLQFVELLTGKTHLTACVVYTGVDLTADEVVSKASAIFTDQKAALSLAESFLAAIKQFRVGNVVAVESNDGNSVQLRLVSVSSSSPG